MAPFPIVTVHYFGSNTSGSLSSYSYPHTSESRAQNSLDSRTFQQASSASVEPLPSTTTEVGRQTHTAGVGWYSAHEPYTLKHLSIWAYLAFGFIVFWASFAAVYTCFRCCRANIVRLDTGDGESSQGWRKRPVVTTKRKRYVQRREMSVASSEVQFLRKCPASVGGSETSLKREVSWASSAISISQSMVTGYERPILAGLSSPSLGSTGAMDNGFSRTCSKPSFTDAVGMENRDDYRKAASVDLFNIPFALPKDSGWMLELWKEPKLSPVRGSIVRPEPAVTVVSRRW